MKKFYLTLCAVMTLLANQNLEAQIVCSGTGGPNLLGAKGTFSTPFITVNSAAASCAVAGTYSYNPVDNIGSALLGCSTSSTGLAPCSDYPYTSASGGLQPEFTYSIVKTIGTSAGGNCLKGDWVGSDHTGDGGYFMAVNGAPSKHHNIFYQILSIPTCIGITYQFSAYVLNVLPKTSASAVSGSEPSIIFIVNGDTIARSGAIAYNNTPTWVKVSGSFTATTTSANLQVWNATQVATGNDLGLDDISLNVCQSQIAPNGPSPAAANSNVNITYTVTDPIKNNTWGQMQLSTDGGANFTNLGTSFQSVFNTSNQYVASYNVGTVNTSMNNYKYRLVIASSAAGLISPGCNNFNDFTLIVPARVLPVKLISFTGTYDNNTSSIKWQTSQELNSDHFELLKSYDGVSFLPVAKIKAAGLSNTVKNYAYQDHVGGSNTVYYRLKQVDVGGEQTYSEILMLKIGTRGGVEVFPNPFNNNFTVTVGSTKNTMATLTIKNINGQFVYSKLIALSKGNNASVISNLPASLSLGVYYLSISNDEINYNCKLQKL